MDLTEGAMDKASTTTTGPYTYAAVLVLYCDEPEWRSDWVWRNGAWVRLPKTLRELGEGA